MRIRPMIAGLALALLPLSAHAQSDDKAAFRALYQEIIETNTTLSVGSCTELAKKIAVHLKAAGIPDKDVTLIVPPNDPRWGNLVAVLHGTDARAKAVLMLAHLDVVEAKASDWGRDPFKLEEKDGFFIARGSSDDKAMASIFVDNLMRYKKEGYRPKRTIKMALTCGEETLAHVRRRRISRAPSPRTDRCRHRAQRRRQRPRHQRQIPIQRRRSR